MKKAILLICTTLAILSIGCQKDKIVNKIVIYNPNEGVGAEYIQEIRGRFVLRKATDSDLGYYNEGYEFVEWSTEDGQVLLPDVTYGNDVYRTLQDISTLNAIWGKVILMRNGSYNLSDGESVFFYDSGGSSYNYQNNENYTFNFYAPQGKHLSVIFYNSSIEISDLLTINGINRFNMPSNYVTPGNSLCAVFTSSNSYTSSGWRAIVSVVD